MKLNLLSHPSMAVKEIGEAVTAPCPRLDREDVRFPAVGAELDLAGLQVSFERGEPEGSRRHLDDPHRAVPRSRHAYQVLVTNPHALTLAGDLLEARELRRRELVE